MTGRWALLPLAGAGFLLAHEASYRMVAHEHDHRHELLAATGHDWMPLAGPALIAMAILAVAAGWFVATRKSAQPKLWSILAVQAGAFVTVEVLERVASGHDPLPQIEILLAGAAAQLPVAFIVWLAFVGILVPVLHAMQSPVVPVVYVAGRGPAWFRAADGLRPQAQLVFPPSRGPPSSGV